VPDTDALRDALDRWKAAIDAQQPERVADVFTEDAIFQSLRPYSVGRQGVINYYASQSSGMTVDYQILQTRSLAPDQVLGYVHADFAFREMRCFQRGASRYVFTTDVSVDEVQAFIRDLVLVLGWFTPLGPYGR
jgi:uncharacterized protein (TIGR02246 family)